ncbi:hypothetical protein DPMN_165240 [Dreissena polymorpha]|uniref:Uncharacterized protein n=1 Tax=Dreissena polymorpha TaxID=45954 RepID=A0A9D4EUE7_DREPO|nr:hypothetical protein DPMN_165240 [Dreissena polymorpha]
MFRVLVEAKVLINFSMSTTLSRWTWSTASAVRRFLAHGRANVCLNTLHRAAGPLAPCRHDEQCFDYPPNKWVSASTSVKCIKQDFGPFVCIHKTPSDLPSIYLLVQLLTFTRLRGYI